MEINQICEKYNLSEEEKSSFLEYISNKFTQDNTPQSMNDDFLEKWKGIIGYSAEHSAAEAVNARVTPLRPVDFICPELVRMEIYHSFAGDIPIIYVPDRTDFENLQINLFHKGVRPEHLEETGAAFAYGKTTRFIILSSKPYSNVPACDMNLTEADWKEKSMIIRREHECTHYYTKKKYGISRNNLHDEIIADFFGITEAFGYYKGEYFFRFIGLAGSTGNRMVVYTEGLPENTVSAVRETAKEAALFLEKWSETDGYRSMPRGERVQYLCQLGLEGMVRGMI